MELFLQVSLEGESVLWGRIPISYLAIFLSGFQRALYRTGEILLDEQDNVAHDVKRIVRRKQLRQLLELDLVGISGRSSSTILSFQRSATALSVRNGSEAIRIFEKALWELEKMQHATDESSFRFDRELLIAWSTVGALFQRGISLITFTLHQSVSPLRVWYTAQGFDVISRHTLTEIEGYVFMVDFKRRRMSLQTSSGESVSCIFTEEQADEIAGMTRNYVRVKGEAVINPASGKMSYVRVHTIEPLSRNKEFWQSRTLDELAMLQGITSETDLKAFYNTWPGEVDDKFERFINSLRKGNLAE
ncbi:hypothetical protein [Chloroflexus sp. Y-396-1]|uniref:hypothetical protein n=1 Tax=Chloroflexus sp. Y-396-1 TaxID=867845 RepID=UPI0004B90169|nr:hypothetical protein [Chloroflexus sp. Y-396-1]